MNALGFFMKLIPNPKLPDGSHAVTDILYYIEHIIKKT